MISDTVFKLMHGSSRFRNVGKLAIGNFVCYCESIMFICPAAYFKYFLLTWFTVSTGLVREITIIRNPTFSVQPHALAYTTLQQWFAWSDFFLGVPCVVESLVVADCSPLY